MIPLKLGVSRSGCVLPGQTDLIRLDLSSRASTRVRLHMRRSGGDPLMMIRWGGEPPRVPRRAKVLADAWDQLAFDTDAAEHSLLIDIPEDGSSPTVGIHNYTHNAERHTPCLYSVCLSPVEAAVSAQAYRAAFGGASTPRTPAAPTPAAASPRGAAAACARSGGCGRAGVPAQTPRQRSAAAPGVSRGQSSPGQASSAVQLSPAATSRLTLSPSSADALSARESAILVREIALSLYLGWRTRRRVWRAFAMWSRRCSRATIALLRGSEQGRARQRPTLEELAQERRAVEVRALAAELRDTEQLLARAGARSERAEAETVAMRDASALAELAHAPPGPKRLAPSEPAFESPVAEQVLEEQLEQLERLAARIAERVRSSRTALRAAWGSGGDAAAEGLLHVPAGWQQMQPIQQMQQIQPHTVLEPSAREKPPGAEAHPRHVAPRAAPTARRRGVIPTPRSAGASASASAPQPQQPEQQQWRRPPSPLAV